MITGLHHFGLAVDDLDKTVKLYESMGFSVFKKFGKESISAKAVMVSKGKSNIELWHFDNLEDELAKKIRRHFAFVSDNLEEDVQAYLALGYKISIPIDTGTVVKRFAYVEDSLGNQIELVEPLEA